MCDIEDEMRTRRNKTPQLVPMGDTPASPPLDPQLIQIIIDGGTVCLGGNPSVYMNRDCMWSNVFYHMMDGELFGVGIAARINYRERPNGWGDYAAYIGTFHGNVPANRGAAYITAHGVKIERGLAESIFRRAIDIRFPDVAIHWRA